MTASLKRHLAILFILTLFCCQVEKDEVINYLYQVPVQTGDGWETTSLNDAGLNPEFITKLMNRLLNYENHLLHGMVIIRHGKLVLEEYFQGQVHPTRGNYTVDYNRETMHVLSSTTKSYTSALLGIAIEKGFINSVHEKVFDFFPELAGPNAAREAGLTIEHMITMSSGLQWDQTTYPILDSRNDISNLQRAQNPWEMYLQRPLVTNPGEMFLYSEGSINVVGEIIKRASGIRLDQFAEQYLFTPLGINQHWWYLAKPQIGWIWASGDLRQRPRDMAKFGQLYLQKGMWNGRQVIPAEWVKKASIAHFTFPPTFWSHELGMTGYSYAWWIKNVEYGPGAFAASGWGDQYIIVMPAYEMIAVFTGGSYYEPPLLESHQIMIQYILPALR